MRPIGLGPACLWLQLELGPDQFSPLFLMIVLHGLHTVRYLLNFQLITHLFFAVLGCLKVGVLGLSREIESIKKLAHIITEAEKSQVLQLASQRPRRSDGIVPVQV